MAASRKPAPEGPAAGPVPGFQGSALLLRALAIGIAGLPAAPRSLAVGLSGGADSAMLALHAALYAARHDTVLHFFHVHHGLQPQADRWRDHVHDLALSLHVPCHSLRVAVDVTRGDGMESAAREARYRAFASLARQTGVVHILLAHHRGDQAETVMLRLLRGTGPQGLAAMAPYFRRDGICYLRPWLDIDRAEILAQAEAYGRLSGWHPVHDPSNADDRYTRAAVRERLAPELDARWPAWRANLVRHARLSAEARQVLEEVAADDLAGLEPAADGASFSLAAWRRLSEPRQAMVLRHWLASQGLAMPTEGRLRDWMRQLRGLHALGHDRQMRVRHGDVWIRCVRGRVMLAAAEPGENS